MTARLYPTPTAVFDYRQRLWSNGYRPLAAYNDRKFPTDKAWPDLARQDPPYHVRTLPHHSYLNTCILVDGLVPIDIDLDAPYQVQEVAQYCLTNFGYAPIRYRGNAPRLLLLYAAAEGEPRKVYVEKPRANRDDDAERVEVLGRGNQFHADGLHPSGFTLQWTDAPDTIHRNQLNKVTDSQVRALLAFVTDMIGAVPKQMNRFYEPPARVATGNEWPIEDIQNAVENIPNFGLDWHLYFSLFAAIFEVSNGNPDAFNVARTWSARCSGSDPATDSKLWDGLYRYPAERITGGTLYHLIRRWHPDWERPSLKITGLRNIRRTP